MSATPTKTVYKSLLREVEKYMGNKTRGQLWKKQIGEQFRKGNLSPFAAKEYTFLIKNIRQQKELMASYNIGTFVDERERLRRSSARVGLKLPNFAEEMEEQLNNKK